MDDPHRITSLEQLRAVIAAPNPVTRNKVAATLDADARQFIAASPLLLMATCDRDFNLDVSPKGDPAGSVLVDDDTSLLIAERAGNKLNFGFQNLIETGAIGLIFIVPGVRETLRINGRATVTRDPALLQRLAHDGKPALLCTRVAVQESFFHCGKALIRSRLWLPESWPDAPAKDAAVRQWARCFDMAEPALRERLEADYRTSV